MNSEFNSVEEALQELREGKMIVVVDDEDRENEGDLIMGAEFCTDEQMNFICKEARGLICLPAAKEKFDEMGLPLMVGENTDTFKTAFSISIDAKGTTTGISAGERAMTARAFANPKATMADFNTPGHMFPLIAKEGGVRVRRGHTEATVDLMNLAGLEPVGICCEIMNEDGTMSRLPDIIEFKNKHGLKLISVEALEEYIKLQENTVEKVAEAFLPTEHGKFTIHGFVDRVTGEEHIALTCGDVSGEDVLVRVHSECLTGDALHSLKCDCGHQLTSAMEKIQKEGRGIIVYLQQEGRGIGIINKIKAYKLQDEGKDTIEANLLLGFKEDERDYYFASQVLKHFGVKSARMLTNNPEKMKQMEDAGIKVVDHEATDSNVNEYNIKYLKTKKEKMGHVIDL